MVEYTKINCKSTNVQLNKLKKSVKSNEGVTLRLGIKKSCAFVFCCLTFSVPLFRWLEHDGCCVCFFVFSLFSLSLVSLTRSH